jgi:hypothetical protein
MTTTQTKDARIYSYVVGTLMVVLLLYGLLTLLGVAR